MKNEFSLKTVIRDGIEIKKFKCPNCNIWGDIDDDQFNGRISILCDCGFHETIDFTKCIHCGKGIGKKLKESQRVCSLCVIKNIKDLPKQYKNQAERAISEIGQIADMLYPVISELGDSLEIECDKCVVIIKTRSQNDQN